MSANGNSTMTSDMISPRRSQYTRDRSHKGEPSYQTTQFYSNKQQRPNTSILYFHTIPWYTCYSLKSTHITTSSSSSSTNLYTATPYTRTSASCTLSRSQQTRANSNTNQNDTNDDGEGSTTSIVADITYNRTKPHIIRFGHLAGKTEEIFMKRCSFMKLRGRKSFVYRGKEYMWRQVKGIQLGSDMVLCETGITRQSLDIAEEERTRGRNDELRDGQEVVSDDDEEEDDLPAIEPNTIVATFKRDKQNNSSKFDATIRVLEVDTKRVDEVMVVATALVMWQGVRIRKRIHARLFGLYAAASG